MRKEKVLHARIPEQLDDELRRQSASLGLSVSTVVRNVLLHTFDLVEGIVIDSADVGRALRGDTLEAPTHGLRSRRGKARPASQAQTPATDATPLGWQELTLNVNAVCEQCNAVLLRGQRAAVGVPVAPRPSFLCLDCQSRLSGSRAIAIEGSEPASNKPAGPAASRRKRSTKAAAAGDSRRTKGRRRKE